MNDVRITVAGNITKEPVKRFTRDQSSVLNFRIAATPRRFDRGTGAWSNETTMYFDVTCWRQLADHVHESVTRGDRVVVVGRLNRDTYRGKDGTERDNWSINADSVSVDLTFATAKPVKPGRAQPQPVAAPADAPAAETVPEQRYSTEAA
jgi:single-strand DNA-binding protein